jgi:DNA polymerase III subunit delta
VADPPSIAFFWGEDSFLLRLAATEFLVPFQVRPVEVEAADWRGGETSDLATPSLWGDRRALMVIRCEDLPDQGERELRGYLSAPAPGAVCVLTQISRAKTPPGLGKLVKEMKGVVRQVGLRKQDLPRWVLDRAKARGVAMSSDGAAALVAAVGEDAGSLDQAVEQLAGAFHGRIVGPEQVQAQFAGLGEQRAWELCDQALAGNLPHALVVLRSLLEAREEPLLLLGVIAARVRDLIRVRSIPERTPPADAARLAGLRFDWQVRRYRQQASRFSSEQLDALHRRLVEADRALKGGLPGDVVLAALVAEMSGERAASLDVPIRVSR